MSTALFIGRFQPFHSGHLDAVRQILKENDRLIIAIGSASNTITKKNPYTANQRIQMIRAALGKTKNYKIILIPDINDPPLWPHYVKRLVGPFDVLYTGSRFTKFCFKEYEKATPLKAIKKNLKVSATQIRNSKHPEIFVPKAVAKLLKKWQA
ncbi:MAG: adenylyltransferase/cytidyltransferase family protein [Candidatus Gracilibacteria bacterium]